ncbi:DUF3488 and transglutaminase-like domain-containing protein [Micromonospora sp. PLK6-60]|uniref:transglutaminase TgpA family protein n=1 Tax=Micromonospora sp. PLK6-60 TaxID=2873383 RepID=UPI001CA69E30|nr:DUF3488 and transglutaminase-like domain-containing protein [Micromonospora sp. PLK6-60]MBY8872791.1 DUF3488 and transglutaminase-like domain-containing protein [Micromonospora sp. PLK6-60]
MIGHRSLGFVAAAATLLAAAPLSTIFQRWTWLIEATLAVAVVAGVAALTRLVRAPLWGQILGMLAGLLLALTWIFPGGTEALLFLPTPATFAHFGELLSASAQDMRSYGVKVPDTEPLLFITVLGIGGVAVLVDVLAVGLRRPALAGLPMLAIYSVPVAVYVDSVPALPFAIGAAGYLWLLISDNVDRVRRFGRRFTGEGRDIDVWEASPLAAAGRRLAVLGVALAVALPLAVPGMTGGLLNSFNSGTGDGTGTGRPGQGSPSRIDLFAALSGQLNQTQVMDLVKVTTTDPDPFYLRLGVVDDLRPNGFQARPPTGQPANRTLPDPSERTARGVVQRTYRATVEVSKNLNMPMLPVYTEPVRTEDLSGAWLYDPNMQILFSNRDNSRGKRYAFDFVRSTYSPELLRQVRPLPSDHPIKRLTVTPAVRQVDALVKELVQGKQTEYDKVLAIYDHFSASNGFSYRVTTEEGSSGEEIVDFLTNKVGYCQQYAAAMAWLVRAAGIPARVAVGFTRGSSAEGNTYTLTNRNLHAWTEVYFDGMGWVPFDATPAYGVQGSTRSAWAPDVDAPEPAAPAPGASGAPAGVDPSTGAQQRDNADRDPDSGLSLGAGEQAPQAPVWPWWVAGGLALLLLLAFPALRRLALRRRRQASRRPARPAVSTAVDGAAPGDARMVVLGADEDRARADAHAAWDELLDTLVDYGVRVIGTETPRATADRLVRAELGENLTAGDAVRLLGRAEERARYAPQPLTGEQLHPALRAVRTELASRADRRTRLLAAVLPPSVLLRWRTGLADRSSSVVSTMSQSRYRLLRRWSPRRLLAGRATR